MSPAALAAASLLFAPMALGIKDADNQGRWSKPAEAGPDAAVPGFLINMGPTGARGILKERSYVVKYIFPKSPAKDVLEIDDEVYGANGKRFSAHTFGGGGNNGIEGPLQDLGLAIEDSEGRDGVLSLMVKRGGADLKVDVQLEALGRFADTFPVNCAKTEILKARAYKYMMDNPGGLLAQGRCVATLALLGSDDRRVFNAGKKMAEEWMNPPNDSTWSWDLGFQGIALGEYYLLTKDRSALKTLQVVSDLLYKAQWKIPTYEEKSGGGIPGVSQTVLNKHRALYEGGFGHCPYPEVVQRGGGGYGPMQWPTCLAIMAWQIGKEGGVKIEHDGIEKALQFLDYGTTKGGSIAYGGEFTLNAGLVDPKGWKANTNHGGSHKSGLGHTVFMLSPDRTESAKMMKLHRENIGAAYKDMPDGHACAMMGLTWGWAGVAASGDAKLKKKVFDYYKAWLNLARCHGSDSYVILPGRDYADYSYYRGNIRNHTTASVAFLYSFGTPKLRVHGASGEAKQASRGSRLAPLPDADIRPFRNADHSQAIHGSYVAFDPGVGLVRVRLRNGNTRDIPFLSLCAEDQEYVKGRITPGGE